MFNFIKKQKEKVIIMVITIMMTITGIPIFSLAVTGDKTAPNIVTNVKSGRIKTGTRYHV